MTTHILSLTLLPDNAQRLSNLCGRLNEHVHQIESHLSLSIQQRGNIFQISGSESATADGRYILETLYQATSQGSLLSPNLVHLALQERLPSQPSESENEFEQLFIKTPKSSVKPRGQHQCDYVRSIHQHDINFGIGPAGTGKTYLAVACAVDALLKEEVSRILLVRPAVEAGEKLGFLPGDLAQKIDPYLRPLYDALYEMLGFEKVSRLIEKNVIEVAPLAYMRGRTLNNSFIILDESQNTTCSQMKMFLTRMGKNAKFLLTGDPGQIDLPRRVSSGLKEALLILKDVKGVGMILLDDRDVIRHRLVKEVIDAYNNIENLE